MTQKEFLQELTRLKDRCYITWRSDGCDCKYYDRRYHNCVLRGEPQFWRPEYVKNAPSAAATTTECERNYKSHLYDNRWRRESQ